jgi:hypothetical protein
MISIFDAIESDVFSNDDPDVVGTETLKIIKNIAITISIIPIPIVINIGLLLISFNKFVFGCSVFIYYNIII